MSKRWRDSKQYRVWRASVIRRDKRCVACGSLKNREAHHKNSGSFFADSRYDINNGVCLCKKCHTVFHTKFKKSFKEKCTEEDFDNFMFLLSDICRRKIKNYE